MRTSEVRSVLCPFGLPGCCADHQAALARGVSEPSRGRPLVVKSSSSLNVFPLLDVNHLRHSIAAASLAFTGFSFYCS